MGAQNTQEAPSIANLVLTVVGIGLAFKVFFSPDEEIPAPSPPMDPSAQYPDCAPLPPIYQFKDDGTLSHIETGRALYLPSFYLIDSMLLRHTQTRPDNDFCRIQEDTIERRMSDAAGMSGVRGPWMAEYLHVFRFSANEEEGSDVHRDHVDLRINENILKTLARDARLRAYDILTLIDADEFQFIQLVRGWRDEWLHEDVHALRMPAMLGIAILKSLETDPIFVDAQALSRIDAGDRFQSTLHRIKQRLPELAIGYFVGGWVSGALRAGSMAILSAGRASAIPTAEAMQLTRAAVLAESAGFAATTGVQGLLQGEWPAMNAREVVLAAGLIFTDAVARGRRLTALQRQSMPTRHEVWHFGVTDIPDYGRSLLKDSLKGSSTAFRDFTKLVRRSAGELPSLRRGTVISVVGSHLMFPAKGPFSIAGLQRTFRENEVLGLFFSCGAGALGTMPGPVGRIFFEQHVLRSLVQFSQARWSEQAILNALERQAWQHLQAARTQFRAWDQRYRVQTAEELVRTPFVGARLLRSFNAQQSAPPPTDSGDHDRGR